MIDNFKGRKAPPSVSIPMSEVTVNLISPPDAVFYKSLIDHQEAIKKAFEVPKEIMKWKTQKRK